MRERWRAAVQSRSSSGGILLADYQTCREPDRLLTSIQAVVFSIIIPLIGLMLAAVTQTCEFYRFQLLVMAHYFLAATPLVPCALLAYTTMLAVGATLRSCCISSLEEEELRRYTSAPILGNLGPASYIGLIIKVERPPTARPHIVPPPSQSCARSRNYRLWWLRRLHWTSRRACRADRDDEDRVRWHRDVACLGDQAGQPCGAASSLSRPLQQFLRHQGDMRLPQPRQRQPAVKATDERSLVSFWVFPRPENWSRMADRSRRVPGHGVVDRQPRSMADVPCRLDNTQIPDITPHATQTE